MSDDTPSGTPKDTHYATLRRAHRDRKRADGSAAPAGAPRRLPQPGRPAPAGRVRLYGIHTVAAALNNPRRKLHSLLVTRNALARLEIAEDAIRCPVEIVEPKRLDAELGGEAVHQGVMLETEPLPAIRLSDLGTARLVMHGSDP